MQKYQILYLSQQFYPWKKNNHRANEKKKEVKEVKGYHQREKVSTVSSERNNKREPER